MSLFTVFLVVQSKRRFERDCKEAERAQHASERLELENKTDGEKVEQQEADDSPPPHTPLCFHYTGTL